MKRIALLFPMLILLAGCTPQSYSEEGDKTYTNTPDYSIYMNVGNVIEARVPDHPKEYPFKWESMDKSVATVDWQGHITATGLGQTEVAASSAYPKQDLSFMIYVHVMPDDVYTFGSSYLKMIPVKGGTFTMGKDGYKLNPAKEVTVQDFQLAEFEITRQLWADIMNEIENYTEDYPKTNGYDAWETEFLPALCKITGKPFRFPTEAEWEYAARAGEETIFSGGDNLDELGWYIESPDTGTAAYSDKVQKVNRPIKHFKPNAFGFYDMSGNVAEWVSDAIENPNFSWDDLNQKDIEYQKDLLMAGTHIAKGGSVMSPAECCTVWSREGYQPVSAQVTGPFGLRVAL